MTPQFNFAILYVDDEPLSLKYFREIFKGIAPIITSECPIEALEIYRQNSDQIGLVLSDHRMPKMRGIEFLDQIMKINPLPLRVLITAYADLNLAVKLLNSDLLYSYLSKPWDAEELEGRLINALEYFTMTQQRDQLLKEKTIAFDQLAIADRANTMHMVSSGLNHHLRNSLNIVSAFVELAPEKIEEETGVRMSDSPFWGELYGEVCQEVGRMIQILSDFSESSDNELLDIQPGIDIQQLFSEANGLFDAHEKAVEVKIYAEGNPGLISGDLQKLQQMSRQLLTETIANLPEIGGQLEVKIASSDTMEGIKVSLLDNGKPFKETDLERIFDPFFTRSGNPDDVGINLLGAYLTVHHHGGKMIARVDSDGRNLIEFELPNSPSKDNSSNYRKALSSSRTVELTS